MTVLESTDADLWRTTAHAITQDAARLKTRSGTNGRLTADEDKRIRDLLRLVGEARGVTVDQILGKRRQRPIAWARAIAMYLVRRDLGLSYPTLGSVFKRHHTTVLTAVQQVEASLSDAAVRAELDELSGRAQLQ